jgi:UDP-N-acetylmuramate dehydrogenase
VGATPLQNVGAYGQDVSQTIAAVVVWDRRAGRQVEVAGADCGFGYRTSRFKSEPARHVVLSVTFRLRRDHLGAPVTYAELARALGIPLGRRAPAGEIREAVLALRRAKGMVLDAADHDTWSAGSFFTNPVVDAATASGLPDAAPRWTQPEGRVKVGAAWLIEAAGFARGHRRGGAAISWKHTLALTNRGSATSGDLLGLAREIRAGVTSRFGITLVNEPVLVGCRL